MGIKQLYNDNLRKSPNEYGDVSVMLLSALGKLFTRVVNNRLLEWSEQYFVLIEAQAGFRANMSIVCSINLSNYD